jgi:hypothetical protein
VPGEGGGGGPLGDGGVPGEGGGDGPLGLEGLVDPLLVIVELEVGLGVAGGRGIHVPW